MRLPLTGDGFASACAEGRNAGSETENACGWTYETSFGRLASEIATDSPKPMSSRTTYDSTGTRKTRGFRGRRTRRRFRPELSADRPPSIAAPLR